MPSNAKPSASKELEKITLLSELLKNLKNFQKFQKILKDSKRFLKIPKDSKRFQRNPKNSKRFQKILKDSKRFKKIQKITKNSKEPMGKAYFALKEPARAQKASFRHWPFYVCYFCLNVIIPSNSSAYDSDGYSY